MFLLATTMTAIGQKEQEEDVNDFNVIETGQQVPDFTITTIEGKTITMSELKGKTVLLVFFATWCKPCVAEMPEVEADIWKKYKSREFEIIAIGRGHSMEEVKTFNKKKGFTYPIGPDKDKSIYEKFFTRYIPRSVLINKEGEIIYHSQGYNHEDFEKLVRLIEEETK